MEFTGGNGADTAPLKAPAETELTMGFTFKLSAVLSKLGTDPSHVPGAGGVLTVSEQMTCTNESLHKRESLLSQAAAGLVRKDYEDDPHQFVDPGRVEAEIATLELLNERDTMLCDDLRGACRIDRDDLDAAKDAAEGGGRGGGGRRGKLSLWALVASIGCPKKATGAGTGAGPPGSGSRRDVSGQLARPESCGSGSGGGGGGGRRDGGGAGESGYGEENEEDGDNDDDGFDSLLGSRKRVFSKYDEATTSILTEWFLAHKRWPYPAAKEKDALAKATKLTTLQISNWFTNKRKRHWTPVIKKRTRSPRDFFEFCVMNPKDQTLLAKSKQQKLSAQQNVSTGSGGGRGGSPSSSSSQAVTGEKVKRRGDRSSDSGGATNNCVDLLPPFYRADQQNIPPVCRNNIAHVHGNGNDKGNAAGGSVVVNAGRFTMPGIGASGDDWLDRSRQQRQQETHQHQYQHQPQRQQHHYEQRQQQEQNQNQHQQTPPPPPPPLPQDGTQHPGALVPGVVHAATGAAQAVSIDPPGHDQRRSSWMGPPPAERRVQNQNSMIFPHGGQRTVARQQGGTPPASSLNTGVSSSQPEQVTADSGDSTPLPSPSHSSLSSSASRANAMQAPQYVEFRGNNNGSASTFRQIQQSHEALPRSGLVAAPGASEPVSQQQQQQQQQQPQQQQHQLQQPTGQQHRQLTGQPTPDQQQQTNQQQLYLTQRPEGQSHPQGTATSMPIAMPMSQTPVPRAVSVPHVNMWSTYRAPSPHGLSANPPGQPCGGDHAPYPPPPGSYYSSPPPMVGHYTAPPDASVVSGVPPVAAFAGGGRVLDHGGTGFAMNGSVSMSGGGYGGMGMGRGPPGQMPPDARDSRQQYQQPHQHQQQQYHNNQQLPPPQLQQQQQLLQPCWGRGWPTTGGGSRGPPMLQPVHATSSDFGG